MGCHRDFTTECAWRSYLQFPHPPSQLDSPPAILTPHGLAFMAPPLSISTPKKSSPCLLHTKTHSAHPSSVTHTEPNSPSPHTSPPSPLKSPPPSPSSLHAAHGGTQAHDPGAATVMPCSIPQLPHSTHQHIQPHSRTDADADGAATAMARSSLLTATSNLNYTTSTLKIIELTNNSTTSISSTASNFTSNSNSIAAQPTLHHEN
nr:hypothetical transcript [Hymenolepis microstoma]